MFNWIKDKWTRFHNWCASWAPGAKTFVVTALGALGSSAALAQEYVTGLPLDKIATTSQILIINIVLFSLAFWARALAKRT